MAALASAGGLWACAVGCSRTAPDVLNDMGGDSGGSSGGSGDSGSGCESGSGSSPPSCAGGGVGLTNCGAGSESCCTSLVVTGGAYFRTYANVDSTPTGEANPATVSSFRLDKYLVTVGRFRQFVAAWNNGAGCLPSAGSGKHTHLNGGQGLVNAGDDAGVAYETGWVASDDSNVAPTNTNLACGDLLGGPQYDTWTNTATTQENLPINCVNWYEAYAFCIWDGGFLPSEAEWEYAAAGGSQQREYPWGPMTPGTNNQYAIYGCYYPSASPEASADLTCAGATNIAPVGTATSGAGLWGQLDLAGEVVEWNLDWFTSYVDPCSDCAYLTAVSYQVVQLPRRVARGGYFNYNSSGLLPPDLNEAPPASRGFAGGFRCARTP